MESFTVPLSHLVLSPKLNARSMFDKDALEALAADFKRHGVLQPPIVRAMPPDGHAPVEGVASFRYEVVAGGRRVRAAELAKLESIPVLLFKLEDKEALSVIASENKHREDFHYLEWAEAWRRWKESGASVDEIAIEMNCKKSWVYQVIAMCGLTPEVKRACWEPDAEKRLTQSVAMELAITPAKVQGQALKAINAPTPDGKKRTARECIELIRTQFRLDLKKSGFDPADLGLKSEACGGAASCEECPFRTGTQPELFEGGPKNDWLCTNTPGYRARQDAQWARQVDDGEHNRGPKCLPDSKAKDLFTLTGGLRDDVAFVSAMDACHQDKGQRTYKTLLGPAADKHIVLARTAARDIVQLVPTSNLQKVLDDAGVIKRRLNEAGSVATPAADSEPSAEEKKAEKEKTVRREQVAKLVIAEVMAKLEKRGPDKRLWRLAADALVNTGLERIWERRGVTEAPSKYLDRLSENQLCHFVIEATLEHALYPTGPKHTEALLAFAKLFGVDVKDHEKTVAASERAQPSQKKADVVAAEKAKPDSEEKPFDTKPRPTPKPKKAVRK